MRELHNRQNRVTDYGGATGVVALLVLIAGCIPRPDVQCNVYDTDPSFDCPPGLGCEEFDCLPICNTHDDCNSVEECRGGLCQEYAQSCEDGESCLPGWGCDSTLKCVKYGDGCHPDVPNICHIDGLCQPVVANSPAHECVCKPGYSGDGRSCSDINECNRGTHDCTGTATCVNTEGGFSCDCPAGTLLAVDGNGCATGWTNFSAGQDFGAGIRIDGTLWTWGRNDHGQLGNGTQNASAVPVQVGESTEWKLIKAGTAHICGIRKETGANPEDNALFCWGLNDRSQVANSKPVVTTPLRITGSWKDVAPGHGHSCGLRTDGSVACWGGNQLTQLGDPSLRGGSTPQPLEILGAASFRAVFSGADHSCAIATRGDGLFCWGSNSHGQLGAGSLDGALGPQQVKGGGQWLSAGLGDRHSCAVLKDNTLKCWGDGESGQTTFGSRPQPQQVAGSQKWTQIEAGAESTCAAEEESGAISCWGTNISGQLGQGDIAPHSGLQAIATTPGTQGEAPAVVGWVSGHAGGGFGCGLTLNRRLFCWGQGKSGELGDGQTDLLLSLVTLTPTDPAAPPTFRSISSGKSHSCIIDVNGKLTCWGSGSAGQLGIVDAPTMSAQPLAQVAPSGGTAEDIVWQAASSAGDSTCAIGKDPADLTKPSTLHCWGSNSSAQLALGPDKKETSYATPQRVPLPSAPAKLRGWAAVSVASTHVCAIAIAEGAPAGAQTGPLYCAGNNSAGQLGVGDTIMRGTLTLVGLEAQPWEAIATSAEHSCGIREGRLLCWGSNVDGQAGLGNLPKGVDGKPSPQDLGREWLAIAVSPRYSCGLRGTGGSSALWCWGALGDFAEGVKTPTPFHNGNDWRAITLGADIGAGSFGCALRKSGSLLCWGSNSSGQLSVGTDRNRPGPALADSGPWLSIAASPGRLCAVHENGAAYCAGANDQGQGGRILHYTPTEVLEPVALPYD